MRWALWFLYTLEVANFIFVVDLFYFLTKTYLMYNLVK